MHSNPKSARLLYTDLGHLAWYHIAKNLVGNFGKKESLSVVSMYCSSYKTQTVLFYFLFSNGRHQQEIGRCEGRNVGSLSSLAPFLLQLLWEKKEFLYCLNVFAHPVKINFYFWHRKTLSGIRNNYFNNRFMSFSFWVYFKFEVCYKQFLCWIASYKTDLIIITEKL